MNIKFEINCEISAEDINNIMVAALEGGINYWCREARQNKLPTVMVEYASDFIGYGGTLIIVEDETGEEHELTPQNFKMGIEKYCKHVNIYPDDVIENHDAESADSIIQFSLFGEIVYG